MKKLLRSMVIVVLSLILYVESGLATAFLPFQVTPGSKEPVAMAAEIRLTTTDLNLRSGPGTGYAKLLLMRRGSEVTVLSTSAGWSNVIYNGTTGYASAAYLTSQSSTYYATTGSVNMRTGPSTSYAVIQKIPKGQIVTVQSILGKWAKLSYNGAIGYSSTSYLTRGTNYITTTSLKLRSGPGTSYAAILTMPSGKTVRVLRIADHWARIDYDGQLGYSSMNYLRLADQTPAPQPAPEPIPQPAPEPAPEPTPDTQPDQEEPTVTVKKIYTGSTSYSGKRIALTFDDYASASQIDVLVEILGRYDAKSTFFFTASWIQNNPGLAQKLVDNGHKLESHTVTHPNLTALSDDDLRYELARSRQIIKETVGTTSYLMRPPYGEYNDRVQKMIGEVGYRYMALWSIDVADWDASTTVSSITQKALSEAQNNAILLLHPRHDKVIEALPLILEQLQAKGYTFATVNEMLP